MKEPRRLLADGDTSELARSLLVAGRERRASKSARGRVWGALAVGLAGGATTASATGSAAAGVGAETTAGASMSVKAGGTALGLTKVKLLVAGLVLVTGAGATMAAVEELEPLPAVVLAPSPGAPAPKRTNQEVPASAAPRENAATGEPVPDRTPEANGGPPAEATARPIPIAKLEGTSKLVTVGEARTRRRTIPDGSAVTSPPEFADRGRGVVPASAALDGSKLREEAALLDGVRAALARHDVSDARSKLQDARRRFPSSRLAQERDALEVRLAIASGDRLRGASLARAFAERYPDSPLRPGIEAIVPVPEKE